MGCSVNSLDSGRTYYAVTSVARTMIRREREIERASSAGRRPIDEHYSSFRVSVGPRNRRHAWPRVYPSQTCPREPDWDEPYTSGAVPARLGAETVALADINLKFVWDSVSAIEVGRMGYACVIDDGGRLIAHPELKLALSHLRPKARQ